MHVRTLRTVIDTTTRQPGKQPLVGARKRERQREWEREREERGNGEQQERVLVLVKLPKRNFIRKMRK